MNKERIRVHTTPLCQFDEKEETSLKARTAWIGCEFSGLRVEGGFKVLQNEALDVLESLDSPEVAYWRNRGYPKPNEYFFFSDAEVVPAGTPYLSLVHDGPGERRMPREVIGIPWKIKT